MTPINSVTIDIEKYDNLKRIEREYGLIKDLKIEANRELVDCLGKFTLVMIKNREHESVITNSMTEAGYTVIFKSKTGQEITWGKGDKKININSNYDIISR